MGPRLRSAVLQTLDTSIVTCTVRSTALSTVPAACQQLGTRCEAGNKRPAQHSGGDGGSGSSALCLAYRLNDCDRGTWPTLRRL